MGEITEEVSNDLVEMDNNGTVRKVYPEIAEFFASRKASEQAWQLYQVEYQKKVAEAAYEKAKAILEAGQVYDSYQTGREAEAMFADEYRAAERRRTDFRSPSRRENARGNPNSWEILAQSSHKEVKWIVDNCLDYESEATTILKHLPATVEELWAVAKSDNSMCEVFDRFMERAQAAGILTDGDMTASMREWSALNSYIRRTYGSVYVRDLGSRVRPIVKVEVEAAVAKARAEWQGLDEARAENIRRNRSEGARRAAVTRAANRAAAEAATVTEETPSAEEENLKEEIPQISAVLRSHESLAADNEPSFA